MKIKSLFESKFIKVFDLQYREEGIIIMPQGEMKTTLWLPNPQRSLKNASGCGELRGDMESVR